MRSLRVYYGLSIALFYGSLNSNQKDVKIQITHFFIYKKNRNYMEESKVVEVKCW